MLLLRPTVGIHLPGNRVGHIHTHTRVGRLISVRRMPRMRFLEKICSFPFRPYDHPPVYSAAEVETSTKALCVFGRVGKGTAVLRVCPVLVVPTNLHNCAVRRTRLPGCMHPEDRRCDSNLHTHRHTCVCRELTLVSMRLYLSVSRVRT